MSWMPPRRSFFLSSSRVAYGAFLLFRTPRPTIVSVVPATLLEGSRQRLEIDGTNLRPFMRVSFDTTPAKSFLIGSTKYALVDLPDLKPGTYDVVLYDYMQEVARLPKAFTVAPLATDVQLEVIGAFKSASDTLAANLKVGRQVSGDRRHDRRGGRSRRAGSGRAAGARRRRHGSRGVGGARSAGDAPCQVPVGSSTGWNRPVHGSRRR